jgi:hypothetical protein
MDIKFNTYNNYRLEITKLKAKEKEIKCKMAELEGEILNHMNENGQSKLDFDGGTFKIGTSKIKFVESKPNAKSEKIHLDQQPEKLPKTVFKTIIDIENEMKTKKKRVTKVE